METNPNPNPPARSKMLRQSSLAPESEENAAATSTEEAEAEEQEAIDRVGLMYLANEGDLEGIKELLNSGTDVNFQDIDKRTALHLAACQGSTDVVQLLLDHNAVVDAKDRWGSTVICCLLIFFFNDFLNNVFVCTLDSKLLFEVYWEYKQLIPSKNSQIIEGLKIF